ncbi:MAG: hypothetical protein LUG83_10005, partial [Lachnospiraceae bacterium]|nr:hypothetical protein [Lachnospiraceae bacterium]
NIMLCACTLCLCAGFALTAPTASISVQASSSEPGISTLQDEYVYVYKVIDNKLYKCLYNATTATYIGDWIYVRDL